MSYIHIKTEQITGGVSTYDIDDIFSADYDVYKIYVNGKEVSTNNNHIALQFRDSSGTITTTNYDMAWVGSSSTQTTLTNERYSAQSTTRRFIYMHTNNLGAGANLTIFNPYSTSYYTQFMSQHASYSSLSYANVGLGALRTFDQVTGLRFYADGTLVMDDINVAVYGLKE